MSSLRQRIDYDESGSKMALDWRVCARARLARDARFDGKFFIAVLTTRIYCRPICPARTCKERNVCYFPTAAAAAEAGYRPCLRCRPECSPGTPAWAGTQTTVSRALRLISESGLENGGVEGLAERLGVGSRHLRRLFLKHLGATPSAVAQTRRLHFAKKLIDETRLPMTQVALASGFGCVRRFNDAVRKVYHRTPTQIRRLARNTAKPAENQYFFRLNYRPPYDWKGLLEFLAARATAGVEEVEAGAYRRTISIGDNHGYIEISLDAEKNAVSVRVEIGDSCSLSFIIERIRHMFDLNADWATISRTLGADCVLAPLVRSDPGIRVPGCWSAFELATRATLEQHLGAKRGGALAGQLVRLYGRRFHPAGNLTHLFPTPAALADADLARAEVPEAPAAAIRSLARAVCDGQIGFERIVDTESLLARLRAIRGIGEWTAQTVAMRALGEPDAFPCSDRSLQSALGLTRARALEQRSRVWQPWRAYAAICLWSMASERKVAETKAARPAGNNAAPESNLRTRISAAV